MNDQLIEHFYHQVVSNFETYSKVRDGDISGRGLHSRSAMSAASDLFHFREHMPAEHLKNRADVSADCPDFKLIADVTNAHKHKTVAFEPSDGPSLVAGVQDIEETIVVTEYEDEDGKYTDVRTIVMVKCSDGTNRSLDEALTNVLNYWGGELKRLNIVDYTPRELPEAPGSRLLSRSEARSENLELSAGLATTLRYKLQRFDYAEGKSNPIDLSGSELTWTAYKPAYSLTVTAELPDGEPINCTIEISGEQAVEFHALETDEDKEQYLNALILDRQEEINQSLSDAYAKQIEENLSAKPDGEEP